MKRSDLNPFGRHHGRGGAKEKIELFKEWIVDHAKIVMPLILIICVAITVAIAFNANKQADTATEELATTGPKFEGEPEEIEEAKLEQNAYPEVNSLFKNYYEAMANGDIDTVASLNVYIDDTEKIRLKELGNYIQDYENMEVYTKPGPVENTYVAYVYSEVKFNDYGETVPGMQAFYVCTADDGSLFINEGSEDESVTDYLRDVSLQDDVVDLNNKATVAYNDLLAQDEELNVFLVDLSERIEVSVGEALAAAEIPDYELEEEEPEEETPQTEVAAQEEEPTVLAKKVYAIDVVNIRSSDSETADKLGKAQNGQEFELKEQRENGWSMIVYEGKDAFIKSEFLKPVEEEAAQEVADNSTKKDETKDSDAKKDNTSSDSSTKTVGTNGKVTVKESVNVRRSASEDAEKLGVAYKGDKLELVMQQADGWCKVNYKGATGYVKTDYVE